MCSARVEPAFIFRGLLRGSEGVLVLGCHFGDCHYISGNYRCRNRMETAKELLEIVGVNPERLYLGWISAAEGQQFAQIVASFTDQLKAMGPLFPEDGKAGDKEDSRPKTQDPRQEKDTFSLESRVLSLESSSLAFRLSAAMSALSSDRIRWLIGKQEVLVEGENVYGEQIDEEEYERLLLESLADEYKCSKVMLSIKDEPLSVKEIAGKIDLEPREVLPRINLLKDDGRVVQADIVGRSPR
jgi:F420-non-reducing hydrogenase iron-sulfur subunit